MAYGTKTITTTATLIVAANTQRRSLHLTNTSTSLPVYIGPDASITTANAIPLYQNQTRDQAYIPEGYQGPVYGIVASSTADVRYWEVTSA